MTAKTDKKPVMDTVKEAFAPVTESLKNLQDKIEVPEAARDFVKRAAGTAQERATDLQAGAEKVTSAIETAVTSTVAETAKVSRNIQQAVYDDAAALIASVDKLASAKCLNDAVQIHSDFVRERGEVLVSRAKDTASYFGKLLSEGAKAAQDNMSKIAAMGKKAA